MQLPDILHMTLRRKEVMKKIEEIKREYIKIKKESKSRRVKNIRL